MRRALILTPLLLLGPLGRAAAPIGAVSRSAPLGGASRAFAPRLPGAVLSVSGAPAMALLSPSLPVLTAPGALEAPETAAAAEAAGFIPVTGRVAEAAERDSSLRALERLGGSPAFGGKAEADAGPALDLLFDRARAGRGDVSGVLAAADGPGAASRLPRRRPVSREQALALLPRAASLPGRDVEEMLSALDAGMDRSRTTAHAAGDLARLGAGLAIFGAAGAALFWGSPAAAYVPVSLAAAALGALLALGFSALGLWAESRFHALDRLRLSLAVLPYLDLPPAAAKAAARRSPGARQDGKAGVFLLSMLALFALGALLGPGNSAGFLVSALKLVGGVITALLGFFGMVFVVDGYGVGDGLERLGRGLFYAALVIGGGWLAGPVLIALVP